MGVRILHLLILIVLAVTPTASGMCSGPVFVDCKGLAATVGVPFTVEHVVGFAFLNVPNATVNNDGVLSAPPRSPGAVQVELNPLNTNTTIITTILLNVNSTAMNWNTTLTIPLETYKEASLNFTTPNNGIIDIQLTASTGQDSKTMHLQFNVQSYPSINWIPLVVTGVAGVLAGALFQRKRN